MKKAEAFSLLDNLRGPINTVANLADKMKSYAPHEPNHRCRRYVNDISDSAHYISKIVNYGEVYFPYMAHELSPPFDALISFSEIIYTGLVGPIDETLRLY